MTTRAAFAVAVVVATLAVAMTASATDPKTLTANTIAVYTATQNAMNATATGLVFADNASLTIPLGATPLEGFDEIVKFYGGLFNPAKLQSLVEVPGKDIQNGDDYISYVKTGTMTFVGGATNEFFAISMWKTDPTSPRVDPATGLEYAPIIEGVITF